MTPKISDGRNFEGEMGKSILQRRSKQEVKEIYRETGWEFGIDEKIEGVQIETPEKEKKPGWKVCEQRKV